MTAPALEDVSAKLAKGKRDTPRLRGNAAAELNDAWERLQSAGIKVVQGATFGTLLLRMTGVTLALVPELDPDGPTRTELVHNAKVDLVQELERQRDARQGIVYMPANTRIVPDTEGAEAMAKSRLSYEVAPYGVDHIGSAVSFLEAWLAQRNRSREQRQRAAQALRARLASTR